MAAAGYRLSAKRDERQKRGRSGGPMTRLLGGVSQVQSVKNVSFVSFTIWAHPKPNADVAKFVSFASLTRKYAPTCVLIGCTICSRRKVPEIHANLWWRRGDQGCDFDDGGAAVKVGERCFLMRAFCIENEGRGKIRFTSHGWVRDWVESGLLLGAGAGNAERGAVIAHYASIT